MKGGSVVGVVATAVGVRRQRRLEDRGAATACRARQVDNTGGSGSMPDRGEVRRSPVMKPVDDRPVWSIVCFFVDRRARGRGLSERMLRAAVDYARSCGARLVEAYPVDRDERSHPDFMFFGAKSMYDRAGFREVARRRPTRPV